MYESYCYSNLNTTKSLEDKFRAWKNKQGQAAEIIKSNLTESNKQ